MKRIAPALSAFALMALLADPVYAAEPQNHKGQGTVNRVDANAGKINMTHGPIPSLKWPGMTMDFTVRDKQALAGLKAGQKVEFKLGEQPKGRFIITEIVPAR